MTPRQTSPILVAFAACLWLMPGAAAAGGVPLCSELAAIGALSAGTRCLDQGQVMIVAENDQRKPGVFSRISAQRRPVEFVNGRRCPYPVRPSDSVFSGGAGYLSKNSVRRVIGCAFD